MRENHIVFLNFAGELPEPLTKEDLSKSFEEYKNGSMEARDKIIIHNIKLVTFLILKRFSNVDYDKDDLLSIGIVALIKAVDSYDKDKGAAFPYYALKCIENEILYFLRKNTRSCNDISLDDVLFADNDGNNIYYREAIRNSSSAVPDSDEMLSYYILRESCSKMPDPEKSYLELFMKGFSYDEIAEMYGLKKRHVGRKIKIMQKKLLKEMDSTIE